MQHGVLVKSGYQYSQIPFVRSIISKRYEARLQMIEIANDAFQLVLSAKRYQIASTTVTNDSLNISEVSRGQDVTFGKTNHTYGIVAKLANMPANKSCRVVSFSFLNTYRASRNSTAVSTIIVSTFVVMNRRTYAIAKAVLSINQCWSPQGLSGKNYRLSIPFCQTGRSRSHARSFLSKTYDTYARQIMNT